METRPALRTRALAGIILGQVLLTGCRGRGTAVLSSPAAVAAGAGLAVSANPGARAPAGSRPTATSPADRDAAPLVGSTRASFQPSPVTPVSREQLQKTYGITILGKPSPTGLQNLDAALGAYPAELVRGITVKYHEKIRDVDPGHWEPGTSTIVVNDENDVQVPAHELAHYLVELKDASWGRELIRLLRSGSAILPTSDYARTSARQGRWNEVAAEAVSLHARRLYDPEGSADLRRLLAGKLG